MILGVTALGDINGDNTQRHRTEVVRVHEDIDKDETSNIALVHLQTQITFNAHVRPICLPSANSQFEGKEVTVTGISILACNSMNCNKEIVIGLVVV